MYYRNNDEEIYDDQAFDYAMDQIFLDREMRKAFKRKYEADLLELVFDTSNGWKHTADPEEDGYEFA